MSEPIAIALQIALIGMALVFTSILLLWGVIALLVRVTAVREPEDAPVITPDQTVEQERKRRAAATAVAIALALEANDQPNLLPQPPTPLVSAWQAVTRSTILDKRGSVR
jgi:Na+-transporting methylmalonyl-CoA/oxaloacetate decarboxylase gamma subunit